MRSQKKILIFGKSFIVSFLVFIVAIGANVTLFCILAAAGTTPSLQYIEPSEPKHVINLEMSPSTNFEQADRKIITDIVQLNASSTQEELPEPAPLSFPSPDINIKDVAIELPGLPIFSSFLSIQSPLESVSIGSGIRTLSVSELDITPSKKSGPLPQYPKWARRDKLEGTITLRFVVTEEGNVEDINIHEIEGDERFGTEAIQAVSEWHFSPAVKAGKPISCWCFQKIDFRLPR